MERGDNGLLRRHGVILMRFSDWVLSEEVVYTGEATRDYEFARLSAIVDNLPLDLDGSEEPLRITLFKGDECLLDGMYFMDAKIFDGERVRLTASILSSKPRSGDAQPR